ncbi:MAG: DUF1566 domain-containing protein [Gammaproteobacteria bacterium]|nr:DUF1566 domain-containing protein [Gammaproteobacteria bacterium]
MSIIKPLITATALMISLTINAQTCNSHIKDEWQNNRYTDKGDGTILDKSTNLIWKKCTQGLSGNDCATGSATTTNWQQALQQANNSTFAGKSDWRLPNIKELSSLVRRNCHSQAINEALFPNTANYFWSSSPHSNYLSSAWAVDFNVDFGRVISDYRYNSKWVRLVRSGQ